MCSAENIISGIIVAGLGTVWTCLGVNLIWLVWSDLQELRKKEQNNGQM